MPVAPPEPRAVPTGLRISSSGEDFIEWIWNAVEGADGYDVQFSPNEAFTSEDEVIARTGEELSYRREDLAAGTSAYLRVRSASGSGDDRITSDWSTYVTGTTAEPPPPPPQVTVSFFPEAVALFEGESAEVAVRYQVRELSAPWKLELSVLGDTTGEDDFELSADTVEIPAGEGISGELPIVLTARTDAAFAEESERASIRFVPDPDQRAALGGDLQVSIRDSGAFPCPGVRILAGRPRETEARGLPVLESRVTIQRSAAAAGTEITLVEPYDTWFWGQSVPAVVFLDWRTETGGEALRHDFDLLWPSEKPVTPNQPSLVFAFSGGQCAGEPLAGCRSDGCELIP